MEKLRLLIVEDEPDLRELIREALLDRCENIYVAGHGLEAIKILRNCPIDAVLTDLTLPHLNGLELLELLRHEGFNTPVLVMSGNFTRDQMELALKLGATDFIHKPFDVGSLTEKVLEALHTGRMIQELDDRYDALLKQLGLNSQQVIELKSLRIEIDLLKGARARKQVSRSVA